MEAFNAVGLKPICVLPNQRGKPRKISQIPVLPSLKFPSNKINPPNITEDLARKFNGSLVFLASTFSAKIAGALTYEEALEQSVNTNSAADFDAGSVVETIVNNPIIIAGGVAVIAVPLILSQVLGGKPKNFGVQSAKSSYAKLADDPNSQLLDIRSLKELREVGSPDIRGLKKKAVSIVYRGEDKPGFLQKLSLKFKDPENTTLYILDKFDGNSELVAELVTANGFKSAYAIKDGAEGPRGWMNSSLPWIVPQKSFSLDLSGLTEAFGEVDAYSVVALGAAAGLGLLAFAEIETVLEVLGAAAIIQVFSKNFLFQEDRKKTLRQLDDFVNNKIAPKDIVSDIAEIGTALLPVTLNKALPAPAETVPEPQPEPPVQPAADIKAEDSISKIEAVPKSQPEASAEINSTPQNEVKAASQSKPLSPYAAYPDFKPPTSPCPSQP
ncbi:unnamed protein product [Amaranthus hypochondriacus]